VTTATDGWHSRSRKIGYDLGMPEMIAVASTTVQQVGYAERERALYVQFKSSPDRTYVYQGVPRSVFDDLLAAPSIGAFVNQQIKGTYAFHTA
jgi:hypothetical protein